MSSSNTRSLLSFFALTFAFSWLFWSIGVLTSLGWLTLRLPNLAFLLIGAHGPLVAALTLAYFSGGGKAVKKVLLSGFKLGMKPVWWTIILLLPFLISGLAVWINNVRNGFQFDRSLLDQPLLILPTFMMMFFLGGSFQEEFGWRGFALPKLLQEWNPMIASLVLGGVWGLWHLPLFFISGTSQVLMPFGVFFLLSLAFSILFTWFFRKTNHNLFSALLFHTAINTSLSVFPPIEKVVGGNQVAMTYMMIAYWMIAFIVIAIDHRYWYARGSETPPIPIGDTP